GMDNILADRLSRIFVPDTKKLEGSGTLARRAAVMKRTIDSVESSNNSNNEHAKKQRIDSKENTKSSIIPDVDDEQHLSKTASPENKQQDTDLFIYASHLDVYETPKDEEQKKELLEKSHLLGHYGITAMEQIIHEEYQMHWKGLRKDIEHYVKNCSKCRVIIGFSI
ncbi:hypothetical protein, partial, partial [Parasitella parasitica]